MVIERIILLSSSFRFTTGLRCCGGARHGRRCGRPATAAPDDGQWDPTLPKLLSSGAPGDPVAIANASFQVSQLAIQTTQDLGQKFLSSLGLGGGPSTGAVARGRVRGRKRSST